MNRKDFLKRTTLASVAAGLPLATTTAIAKNVTAPNSCTLIPSETAGPFPLDLTENTYFFRQDIRESETGANLNVKIKVIGNSNCEPMANVRVNIWHCDKDGVYSGYATGNNPGSTSDKYLRGYQFTDANGEVEFVTIFPGWYTGRIAHIHFQVYVSSAYAAVSQMTFDIATKNAIYAAYSNLYTKGADPLSFSSDNIFADGYSLQLATLTPNTTTGGYDAYLEVTVQGTGVVGVGHIEKETAKVFELGQNYPNPYSDKTNVPITLKQPAQVKMELWNLSGQKVATVMEGYRPEGTFEVEINPIALGLPMGNYIYQFEAATDYGTYRMPKMMTMYK